MERWGLAVNTWAGFSSREKIKLAFYGGTLDADSYQNILKNSLLPAAQEWYEDEKGGWELQQDKASCHTAKSTERWLEQHGVDVVEGWPRKVMTLTRSRTFGPSSTRDLSKKLRHRME